jgi:hypothetical protein
MKERFRIRITSGEAKGRYVGARFDGSAAGDPALQDQPPIDVPGSEHGLHENEKAATEFFEGGAQSVQAELQLLGYESELVAIK